MIQSRNKNVNDDDNCNNGNDDDKDEDIKSNTKITTMMTNDCSCNEYFDVDEYHDDYDDDLYNSGSNKNYDDKTTTTMATE